MQYEGQPIEVEYIQHYPPDTQAASLWLRNRQPGKWRDVQKGERDHTTTVTLSLEERDRLAKKHLEEFWGPVIELEAQELADEAEQERQDQLRAGGAPYEQTDPTH
jgi:hypothetical protein